MRFYPSRFTPIIAICIACLFTSFAQGQNNWIGGDGVWNNSSLWSAGVPTISDDVRVDNSNAVSSLVRIGFSDPNAEAGTLLIDSDDQVRVEVGRTLSIAQTLTSNGTLHLDGVNNVAGILFGNGGQIDGSGRVLMTGDALVSSINADDSLTIGANALLEGRGRIGNNLSNVINNGTIEANSAGSFGFITLDPGAGGFQNNNVIRAKDNGDIRLTDGTFDNTNGLIDIQDTSQVELIDATLNGGTIQGTGTGELRVENGSTGTIGGTITNNAIIATNSINAATRLRVADGTSLVGTGTVHLRDGNNSIIEGVNLGDTLSIGANQLVHGAGEIGNGTLAVTNNGTIDADEPGLTGFIKFDATSGFNNNGTMKATAGDLRLSSGSFSNSGQILSENNRTVSVLSNASVTNTGLVDAVSGDFDIQGSYVQTAGTTRLTGGDFSVSTLLEIQGGVLEGNGDIAGDVQLNGTLRPGLSAGSLTMDELSLGSLAQLEFEIGGLNSGTEFDFVDVDNDLSLGGNLNLSFLNGFESQISSDDTFTIMDSGALSGDFGNVANGGTLQVANSSGSFQVWYGTGSPFSSNSVVIGNFSAVPEPSGLAILFAGSLAFVARRRRRTA